MCMDIQLVEALCGFQKPISTLDNRTIVITSHPGMVTRKCFFLFWCSLLVASMGIEESGNSVLIRTEPSLS